MADIAITFGAPMVKGLLAGRKTQTRRLAWKDDIEITPSAWQRARPGDRLWVREAFATGPTNHGWGETIYRATFGAAMDPVCEGFTPWKFARRMPKRCSRITLTVADVALERLHYINDEEAIAEGVVWSEDLRAYHVPGLPHPDPEFPVLCRPTAREMFAALWDTIHRPGAWLGNPEVVTLTFTVVKANIDADPDAATGCADDALPDSTVQAARAWLDGRGTP
jgi:hypothetical protein